MWWGVFGTFCLCSLYMLGWIALKLYGACAGSGSSGKSGSKGKTPIKPRMAVGGDDVAPLTSEAAAGSAGGAEFVPPQGWVIPFVVLWSGYLLNLVPYIGELQLYSGLRW